VFRNRTRADRKIDASHPDVIYLLEYVVELETELTHARDYLETCRKAAGARRGEMLLDAIRRKVAELPDRSGQRQERLAESETR
jgi:hypothetical protein